MAQKSIQCSGLEGIQQENLPYCHEAVLQHEKLTCGKCNICQHHIPGRMSDVCCLAEGIFKTVRLKGSPNLMSAQNFFLSPMHFLNRRCDSRRSSAFSTSCAAMDTAVRNVAEQLRGLRHCSTYCGMSTSEKHHGASNQVYEASQLELERP